MQLSTIVIDLGRPVAYYPGLRHITGSTTSTIFLCQLLYWSSDKRAKKDGWIYKTSVEIEEETGLSYNEQKTARNNLLALGLIEEERLRLDHTTRYRIAQNKLDELWSSVGGNVVNLRKEEAKKQEEEEVQTDEDIQAGLDVIKALEEEKKSKPVKHTTLPARPEKLGDAVDLVVKMSRTPAIESIKIKDEIRGLFSTRLRINVDGKKWDSFIDFAYNEQKQGRMASTFIDWALDNGFNPIFWTADKMRTLYPQAFYVEDKEFIEETPESEVKKDIPISPMPKDLGRRKNTE